MVITSKPYNTHTHTGRNSNINTKDSHQITRKEEMNDNQKKKKSQNNYQHGNENRPI